MLHANEYGGVFMDIQIPGINEMEATAKIRQAKATTYARLESKTYPNASHLFSINLSNNISSFHFGKYFQIPLYPESHKAYGM